MRSDVNVILSNPPTEPNMSHPDYQQTVHHHQCLLVLVRHIGQQLKPKAFSKIYEHICRTHHIKINDSQGLQRNVWVRYVKNYPVENNDWGDFQSHRKVLGLVCVGQCSTQKELEELCRIYESLKVKYSWTLYNSRCILFGLRPDVSKTAASPIFKHLEVGSTNAEWDSGVFEQQANGKCEVAAKVETEDLESPASSGATESCDDFSVASSSEVQTPTNSEPTNCALSSPSTRSSTSTDSSSSSEHKPDSPPYLSLPGTVKARLLCYPAVECCEGLDKDLVEFISSLFWVLESKRMDKARKKVDRVSLLCAPFEKSEMVGLEQESRPKRRKYEGRMKKHLADLSLQSGLPSEAIQLYWASVDILKSSTDWLWIAAAYEGICAASAVTLFPHLGKVQELQRNSSFQGDSPKKQRSNSVTTSSLPNGLDPVEMKQLVKNCLTPEEIYERFTNAIQQYRTYRNAAVIEMEASVKAAQVMIEQKWYIQAAEFLKNVVILNLQVSEDEKINRFTALSEMYGQMGFKRKAAFYQRVAASRCVHPQKSQPDWFTCYQMLLQCLEGYKLSLDPATFKRDVPNGWPILQAQLLQELVGSASSMGNSALAARHSALLLHALLDHLSPAERQSRAMQLANLSARVEGGVTPVPLALEDGTIVPPVNLIHLPQVRSFQLQNLPAFLQPQELHVKSTTDDDNPFLFTPLHFGSWSRDKQIIPTKMDFLWVEGDVFDVQLHLSNILPFELKISQMSLLTENVPHEPILSSNIFIPAEASKFPVTLQGIARGTGELQITGYSNVVLGVRSNCKLKHVPRTQVPHVSVDVVPALPRIELATSLPKSNSWTSILHTSHVVTSAGVTLFTGESQECTVTLTNISTHPVETVDITLESLLDKNLVNEVFKWSADNLLLQLPIQPGASASFTVYIYGTSQFLVPEQIITEDSGLHSHPGSYLSHGPSSLPSRLSSLPSSGGTRSKARRTESISSHRSGSSIYSTASGMSKPSEPTATKVLEAELRIKYSGGPGLHAEYCRCCSVAICVEVVPSLRITKWDVLPSETSSHFYLVLDVLNTTIQEMELQYTPTKHILIESNETCRIPVPVERCPLSKLGDLYTKLDVESLNEMERICSKHVASLVDLKWTLTPSETMGKASVRGIRWTAAMLDLVRMSPLQWEVCVNSSHVKPTEEVICVVGEPVNLNLSLHNESDQMLTGMALRIQCYQDHQNGYCNYRMDARVSIVGADRTFIEQIPPSGSYTHSCCVLFFTPGLYKVDLQCTTIDSQIQNAYENISVPGSHTSKYTPPLEILVKDC